MAATTRRDNRRRQRHTREGKWKVVLNDSPKKLVHDPSRPILVDRVRKSVYDRGNVADDVLERPLRNFFVIPEGCWRPWDLHPETTVRSGKCVVSMLHSSFIQRNKKRVIENGRTKHKLFYDHVMTEALIEQDLEKIFVELKYAPEEFPYESGWRVVVHD